MACLQKYCVQRDYALVSNVSIASQIIGECRNILYEGEKKGDKTT